jgi:hypothetical protein
MHSSECHCESQSCARPVQCESGAHSVLNLTGQDLGPAGGPKRNRADTECGNKEDHWHSHHIVRHIPDWLRASRSPEYQCRHGTARKRNWKSRRSTRIRQMVRSHQSLRSIPNWLCAVCSFSSPMLEIQIAAWQWHVALHNA